MRKMLTKRSLAIIVLCSFIAVIVFLAICFGKSDVANYVFFAKSYEKMDTYERDEKVLDFDAYFYSDDLVKLPFYGVIDCCAEDDEGRYYVVPYGEETYAIIYVDSVYVPKFEDAADAMYEYRLDETGELPYPYFKEGENARVAMYPLEDDLVYYYEETMTANRLGDYKDYIEPYLFYYQPASEWGNPYVAVIIASVIGGIILVIGLVAGLSTPARFFKKMREKGIPEEELEEDLENADNILGNLFGEKYIVLSGLDAFRAEDFVWAFVFTQTTRHKIYGIIPAGTTHSYSLRMFDKNGKFYESSGSAREADAERMAELVATKYSPNIYVGHSEQIAALYSQNPAMFIENIKANRLDF
ncbi:MAG: hypothetical protein IKL70_08475 [Oscillospiraceae bacterium]|nr:hypothetical protein [Oscillospiraceae bacterium]